MVPTGEWVLLAYRVPREPSTPRIAIWRKLKQLGVAQLGDGLVALPADARTREQLEWAADDVLAAGGTASVWLARPASTAAEREFAAQMAAARGGEYAAVTAAADAAATLSGAERQAAVRRLRNELRRIGRRDFFPPSERDAAQLAVRRLTDPDAVEREPGSIAEPAPGARS
ncbi:Chromate resistance protein ChrB [Jidongwangia harbinensis]|uniref:Chromate resistance protein ChrB n=1 Tax=Jidongwangia harbinensis TaxID=2878561 RepID=UPI001CD98738|nr:Chromate resistance protein ChrB [Jidongwangia harbinensis]MCA2211716.1 chromate resistance protein [Jidongwangia harbinensis]